MKPTKVRKHRPYQQLPESFSRRGLDEQSIQQATGMHAAQEEYFSRSKKTRWPFGDMNPESFLSNFRGSHQLSNYLFFKNLLIHKKILYFCNKFGYIFNCLTTLMY